MPRGSDWGLRIQRRSNTSEFDLRFEKFMVDIRKRVSILFFAFLPMMALTQVVLPGDDFIEGWNRFGRMRQFEREDLFNYIDGGAELFHEFGFEAVWVQHYKRGDAEITLEVYAMESPSAALGVYLMKCGDETPIEGIGARNTGNRFQLTLVRGKCFIQINSFDGDSSRIPVMMALAQSTVASIKEGEPDHLLDVLPEKDFVKGSEMLVRGPVGLQQVFTFGEGDILQLKGRVFAILGEYEQKNGNVYTRIIVPYPDDGWALSAYEYLVAHLDSYLTVIEKRENGFTFRDYQNKVGIVEMKESRLDIQIHLSGKL
ncbi:MAG: DUF6599 family protein [bacterium]